MGADEKIAIEEVSTERALLSSRELECLKHLARGYTIKVIAEVLSFPPQTMKYYLDGIKRKLNRSNKKQLIEFYLEYIDNSSRNKKKKR